MLNRLLPLFKRAAGWVSDAVAGQPGAADTFQAWLSCSEWLAGPERRALH